MYEMYEVDERLMRDRTHLAVQAGWSVGWPSCGLLGAVSVRADQRWCLGDCTWNGVGVGTVTGYVGRPSGFRGGFVARSSDRSVVILTTVVAFLIPSGMQEL